MYLNSICIHCERGATTRSCTTSRVFIAFYILDGRLTYTCHSRNKKEHIFVIETYFHNRRSILCSKPRMILFRASAPSRETHVVFRVRRALVLSPTPFPKLDGFISILLNTNDKRTDRRSLSKQSSFPPKGMSATLLAALSVAFSAEAPPLFCAIYVSVVTGGLQASSTVSSWSRSR